MIAKIKAFFSPARRKAIYIVVGAAAGAVVAFGIITQDQLNTFIEGASSVLSFLALLMAAANTHQQQ